MSTKDPLGVLRRTDVPELYDVVSGCACDDVLRRWMEEDLSDSAI